MIIVRPCARIVYVKGGFIMKKMRWVGGSRGTKRALWVTMLVLVTTGARSEETGNMVFFRGGAVALSGDRGSQVFTDVGGATVRNDSRSGYYVGAGLDLLLTRDLWGMMNGAWALGEIGLEFKRFNSKVVRSATNALTGLGPTTETVPLTMLTIDVSPKFKWGHAGRLKPWIIPG